MNKHIFAICGLIVFWAVSPAFAQWTGTPGRRNAPVSESPCWMNPDLRMTPEQLRSLDSLHRSFYREQLELRNQYITEHYELRSLLDNPKTEAKLALAKQNDLSATQKKMDEISIQYFLKARAVFSPEQISKLPPGCNLGFNYGPGKGRGRGMGQRNRF